MNKIEELKKMSIPIKFEIDNTFEDKRFIKGRARIMHDGINLNSSNFNLDSIERAASSLANVPILANVVFDSNNVPQFGAHDIILEKDRVNDGEYREIYLEKMIGIIPETNNYEVKKIDDRNYVFADFYIHRGYCGYAEDILNRDKNVGISMEISVNNFTYESSTKMYDISDYFYTGVTMLGNEHTPAMHNALATIEPTSDFNLEKFTINNKENILKMMSELKDAIQNYNPSNNDVDIDNKFCNKEGGNKDLDEKLELLKKFGLNVDNLDFKIDDLSLEDFTLKLNEFNKKQVEYKFYATNKFALTANQKREALRNSLSPIYESNGNGEILAVTEFWLDDFDDNFAYVEKNRYSELDSTNDFGRISYSFDTSNFKANITGEFEKMIRTYMSVDDFNKQQETMSLLKYTEADIHKVKDEFETYKSEYTTKDTDVKEFEELKSYKAQKELEEFNEAKDSLFSQFEDLKDIPEFETLKSNTDFTLDDIEKELFCMRGKKLTTNFTAVKKKSKEETKSQFSKIPLMQSEVADITKDSYDDLYEKYNK